MPKISTIEMEVLRELLINYPPQAIQKELKKFGKYKMSHLNYTDPSKLSMIVYHLKCKNCEVGFIGQTKRICDVFMNDHQSDKNSHAFEHHNICNLLYLTS
jgi:hypothetical protein